MSRHQPGRMEVLTRAAAKGLLLCLICLKPLQSPERFTHQACRQRQRDRLQQVRLQRTAGPLPGRPPAPGPAAPG